MKKLTKVLSILLVATFMLGLLPAGSIVFSASAATETTLDAMLARAEAMVNYEWTPTTNIATWNGNSYNGLTYFPAGQTVKGMPYTLFTWEMGFDSLLSLAQFDAVASSNYSTTTYCNSTGSNRTGPVYGNCCATFVSEVFGGNYMNGSNPRYDGVTALKNSSYGTTTTGVKATAIKAGDALVATGVSHIVWVGEVTASNLTIYESTPPIAKKTTVPLSSVNASGYLVHDGVVYSTTVRSNALSSTSSSEVTTSDISGIVATSVSDFKSFVPITVYPCTGARFYAYLEDRTTQDGQIWPEDKCVIKAIYDDGWVQVEYPVTGGTKTRYSQLSNFVADTSATPKSFTATAQVTAYQYSDLATSTGYLSAGDKCYTVAAKGSATQVLYPITGGYKLAWVQTSQLPAITATYAVTYNANGGSGAPAAQTKTQGTALTLSSTRPTRTGYTFLGWATSSSATSATYQPGGTYTTDAAVTLYAVWKTATYTITYNANGGTGAPAAQTKTYGTALTLSSTKPTRTGYTFLGWATSATTLVPTYLAGGTFATNANTTLYAVWQANTYTITYDANGGAYAPAAQTKTHGTALTLSTTAPTRPNYTFLGWATTATATAATYQPGASFTGNANTTLYAVWKAKTIDASAPQMIVSSTTAKEGDTIEVTVTMKNNPGIFCYVLKPEYDKTQLSLVNVTAGANMGGTFTLDNLAVWLGDTADVTTDQVAMVMTFQVLEGASGTSAVSVSYQAGDICNYDEEDVDFYVVAGSVTVEEEGTDDHVPGDVNGDGVCNNKDLTRLKKYMSDPEGTTVSAAALDINGDGLCNNKDLTRLKKYMSDPENVEIF